MIDQKTILDLIETIYLCGSGNADWQIFLDQFGSLFPALKLALIAYDNFFSDVDVLYSANFDPHFVGSFAAFYLKLNHRQNVILNSPSAPEVTWGHEAVPIRESEKTKFHADRVEPQNNVATGFTTMLVKEEERFVNLSVNFSPKHIKEAQSAARTIEVIGPHLRRAFKLYRQSQAARIRQDSYQSILNTLLAAVFIIDGNGKIIFSNEKGECLLREERIIKTDTAASLRFTDARDDRAVNESIRHAATRLYGAKREFIPLHIATPRRYIALVTTLSMQRDVPARRGSGFLLPVAPIAVFIIDSSEMPQAKIDTVARALRVTPAEARLALALMHDKSLKQYASENGISIHTARAQMQSLLSKTGANRQAALVRLLANVFSTLNLA